MSHVDAVELRTARGSPPLALTKYAILGRIWTDEGERQRETRLPARCLSIGVALAVAVRVSVPLDFLTVLYSRWVPCGISVPRAEARRRPSPPASPPASPFPSRMLSHDPSSPLQPAQAQLPHDAWRRRPRGLVQREIARQLRPTQCKQAALLTCGGSKKISQSACQDKTRSRPTGKRAEI